MSGGFCKTRTKMITLARQSQKRQKTFNCVIRSQSRETARPLVLLLISIEKVATNPGVLESDVYVCSITFKAKYLGCKEVTPIQSAEYGKLTYKSNFYSNRALIALARITALHAAVYYCQQRNFMSLILSGKISDAKYFRPLRPLLQSRPKQFF